MMENKEIINFSPKAAIEAILFVSENPITIEQINPVLSGFDTQKLRELIQELKNDYDNSEKGLRIEEVAGGYQLVTSTETADVIKEFFKQRDAQKLSRPALETLAIIAYKQPVTRLDIESLRGVNADGVIKSLLEKNLIRITGKRDIPGHPYIYGTTRRFLEYFGLNAIDDLPKADDFSQSNVNANTLLSLSNRAQAFVEGEDKGEFKESQKTD